MNNELLIELQHFFESDNRIKKEMYSIAPVDNSYLDEESIIKYTDNLNDSLIYIFSELKCIVKDLFGIDSFFLKKICAMEEVTRNKFYACGSDMTKLKTFYTKYISNMDPDFVNSVKSECVGYYVFRDTSIIEKAFSINELLHFIHSYVLNNDQMLQSIPSIKEKNSINNEPISLRGVPSQVFEQLYNNIPADLDIGITDMVVVNQNKLIMMVRDRGHALSIEVTLKNDIARFEYFIPKIINRDMVNSLPGINLVNENSVGATGVFEVPQAEMSSALYDFISKVPTDLDLVMKY